jgi:hypothetical protein
LPCKLTCSPIPPDRDAAGGVITGAFYAPLAVGVQRAAFSSAITAGFVRGSIDATDIVHDTGIRDREIIDDDFIR